MPGNAKVKHRGSHNEFPLFIQKCVHRGREVRLKQLCVGRNFPSEVGRCSPLVHHDIHTWAYLADHLRIQLPEQEMQLSYSELDKLQMKKKICQVF